MDLDELLTLMTLGAVLPYVTTAAATWMHKAAAMRRAATNLVQMHQGDALSQ